MSGRFVRASKYRKPANHHPPLDPRHRIAAESHIHILPDSPIHTYIKNAWDTNLVKCNPKYVSVNWEASGGGAFAVIPLEERGKLPEVMPLFRGHTAAVLDHDWSPFNDDIVASASDDGKVCLWKVPDNFTLRSDAEEPEDVLPVGKLTGHGRKVGHVLFNPAAENVLASSSGDYTVKIWDLEDGKPKITLKHNDMVQSLSWSSEGNMLVTSCRDKKLRFWDVRQEKPAHEVAGHSGAKSSRVCWLGDHDRVATTGFSKMSDRQLGLWDPRNPSAPIGDFTYLDSQSGICMPFWDDGSQMLYLAGKGDGNIRYYEYENDKFEPLSEYKSPEPQRGLAFMPKRGVNTHANEVMRAFKTVNDQLIEPISFVVPRRAEVFQDDIYPPAIGNKPAMSSAEWLEGKTARPAKVDMGDLHEGQAPKEYAAEEAPKAAPAKSVASPAPTPAAAPKAEPKFEEPQPAAPREIPSMKDNQQSMSDMANKFAEKDAESSDDEPSSPFEEIPKPIERPSNIMAARQEEKVGVRTPPIQHQDKTPTPTATSSAPTPEPASRVASSSQKPSEAPASEPSNTDTGAAVSRSASSAAGGLKEVLGEIRGMLQAQGRQIEALTQEVAELKMRVK
ncbi:hypothetical protein Q7P37_008233 [Cladosporium fusiforme]